MNKNFSSKGYTIIKKGISINLISKIQKEIYSYLNIKKNNNSKNYKAFVSKKILPVK